MNTIVTKTIWYKIPEIAKSTFLGLVSPLYDIVEGRKVSKSQPDPFAQECWKAYVNQTQDQWEIQHKIIQKERSWTMKWGDFHQACMGSFPGWQNYKTGHETKCDIGKTDNTCVAEIKNNTNTMNSGGKESVEKKLNKQKELGKRVLLIVVNGDIPHRVIDGIEYISGRKFYEELSGRPDFMDDLLATTQYAFANYKTFEDLKKALETV